MLNLFKMDLWRLFHGKMLYIMIAILTVVTFSSVFMIPDTGNMIALFGAIEQMDFLASNSGIGVIYMILGLMTTMFICNDYVSGFAKNIFAVHANKKDYFFSKLLAMMVASGVLILTFTVEAFAVSAILGRAMIIESVFGFILFLLQKWLVSAAFIAISIFVNLLSCNKGVGSIMAFLIGSGGLIIGSDIMFGISGILRYARKTERRIQSAHKPLDVTVFIGRTIDEKRDGQSEIQNEYMGKKNKCTAQ